MFCFLIDIKTQGLGTALKILYSEKLNHIRDKGFWHQTQSMSSSIFRLKRTEIVSLINAFARLVNIIVFIYPILLKLICFFRIIFEFNRLSNSISQIDKFRSLLR